MGKKKQIAWTLLFAPGMFCWAWCRAFAPDRARLYRRGVRAADGGRTLCGAGLCRGRRCGLLRRARGVHPGPGGRALAHRPVAAGAHAGPAAAAPARSARKDAALAGHGQHGHRRVRLRRAELYRLQPAAGRRRRLGHELAGADAAVHAGRRAPALRHAPFHLVEHGPALGDERQPLCRAGRNHPRAADGRAAGDLRPLAAAEPDRYARQAGAAHRAPRRAPAADGRAARGKGRIILRSAGPWGACASRQSSTSR